MLAKSNKDDPLDNITLKRAEKLYKELLVEANAQLGLMQLPEDIFGRYKQLIRITQYEEMKRVDFDGKDPRVELKREKIALENKNERQVYT